MEAPRPVARVTYTILAAGEGRRRARQAALKRLAPRLLVALLAVGVPVHALVDSTVEVGPVHVLRTPLDRDYEQEFTWRGTVDVLGPGGVWVWPTLEMASVAVGNTNLRDLAIPELRYETFVDGERVMESGFGGDFGGGVSGHDTYGCAPTYACPWPEWVWGVHDVDVEIRATVTHQADPRARGLVHEYTLGPMLVVMDRCPCIKSLY